MSGAAKRDAELRLLSVCSIGFFLVLWLPPTSQKICWDAKSGNPRCESVCAWFSVMDWCLIQGLPHAVPARACACQGVLAGLYKTFWLEERSGAKEKKFSHSLEFLD